MPEGVGYSGSNVVAGVGKSLNYVGEFAFAYSGFVTSPASTDTFTLLEFTTGSGLIIAKADFFYPTYSNDNFRYRILINDEDVVGVEVAHGADANLLNAVDLVVPAYSTVKFTAASTVGNAVDQCATFTGKVYK